MSESSIFLTDVIAQDQGIVASDMAGEKVMLSVERGKYYNLGKTGGVIWDLIQSPVSVAGVIELLTDRYSVDRETCEQDVLPFLEKLRADGLIIVKAR
ncbi:lasso peptide biosynthesis PqqD family chaperone [Sporolactobacillus sp. Y61]|uniref:Lasso peptide biosynthesis PqqD family chaperone n=1 Tax=Sporolactobacillus sp. Y61 TaxID=3160863 RepID=A0AAU8IJD7_9BACL